MSKKIDLFGLEREMKILEARVRDVFTPHTPVNSVDLFFGRQKEVNNIIEQINTKGQHSLLYGERGVGKSSLANVAANLLLSKIIKKLYTKRCDSTTTFESILREPLLDVGIDINVDEAWTQWARKGNAGFDVKIAKSDFGSEKTDFESRKRSGVSPSHAAEILKDQSGLLLIDEADALGNKDDSKKLAEFIKLLSDYDSKFKVIIVGVADTAEDLTGGHPSVARCLRETKLDRMKEQELSEIVVEGAKKLGLEFKPTVIRRIVRLSAGYPHFTHLLALKCAENAVADSYKIIEIHHLQDAMHQAVEDAEGTLKRMYESAIRSHGTNMYRTILNAAANLDKSEFTAKELRISIANLLGGDVSQSALNNYYTRLISDSDSTILRRMAKGVYRFNDPRMPSFIKIALQTE